jgi:hypothetical protein
VVVSDSGGLYREGGEEGDDEDEQGEVVKDGVGEGGEADS